MFVIIGYLIISASVFGGFVIAGGHVAALFQPVELLMIGGAALGAFVVGNNPKIVKATIKELPGLLKGSRFSKVVYLEVLTMLFDLLNTIRREGMLAVEKDVENPHESALFNKYPNVMAQHHAIEFLTDYLRVMMIGNTNPFELEALMDVEIDTHHKEAAGPVNAITKLGDGMPAFGIVAAVMGVVHTMESIGLPPAELGILIAHALVGTFLGILLAYGFVGPLATLLEQRGAESGKVLDCIKVTLLATANGYAPSLAVEYGRKTLYSSDRPTFKELEDECAARKAK
ncbi:MAG: flagellar motor stator protein MotA [Nitrospirae bacterium]|nr:flagellar motor stator protein MotA [Nitrospirota bacterium]